MKRLLIAIFCLTLIAGVVQAGQVNYTAETDTLTLSQSHDVADSVASVVDGADTQYASYHWYDKGSTFRVRILIENVTLNEAPYVQNNINDEANRVLDHYGINEVKTSLDFEQ